MLIFILLSFFFVFFSISIFDFSFQWQEELSQNWRIRNLQHLFHPSFTSTTFLFTFITVGGLDKLYIVKFLQRGEWKHLCGRKLLSNTFFSPLSIEIYPKVEEFALRGIIFFPCRVAIFPKRNFKFRKANRELQRLTPFVEVVKSSECMHSL